MTITLLPHILLPLPVSNYRNIFIVAIILPLGFPDFQLKFKAYILDLMDSKEYFRSFVFLCSKIS